MSKKNIWYAVLLLILTGGGIGVYLYTKPAGKITTEAQFTIQPDKLAAEFDKDEKASNVKYIGKGVQFKGTVSELGDNALILTAGEDINVKCSYDSSLAEKFKAIVPNDEVELLCECSGYTKPESTESLLSSKELNFVRCNLVNFHKGKVDLGTQVETATTDSNTNKK